MSVFIFSNAHKRTIAFIVLIIATVNFFLLVGADFNKSLNDLWYLDFLLGLFSIVFFIAGYINWRKKYESLRETLDSGGKIDAFIPQDDEFYPSLLNDVIKNKNLESEIQTQKLKNSFDELNDYITKWVHEIKIPISVCELILEKIEEKPFTIEFQRELEKIKFLTNQVLYISRASNYYEDLSIKYFNLSEVVKNSIKRNSTLLISKNIKVSIFNLDYEILSDEKWISYILDQILNNAYKYVKPNGKITISASTDQHDNVIFTIRDNGIGILPKDIPNIFNKSFTGNNKSNLSKSTGMGLYISQKMLDKLGHKIEVKSEPNVFTEFTIIFYRISDNMSSIT